MKWEGDRIDSCLYCGDWWTWRDGRSLEAAALEVRRSIITIIDHKDTRTRFIVKFIYYHRFLSLHNHNYYHSMDGKGFSLFYP